MVTTNRNLWLIAAAAIIAPFMEVLDTSIANIALPHIAGSLSATPEEAQRFLSEHTPPLQPLSQPQFDAIYDGTWQDYFKSVR